jgi:hypothetical protein
MRKEPPLRRPSPEPSRLTEDERRSLLSAVRRRRGMIRYAELCPRPLDEVRAELKAAEERLREAGADPDWDFGRMRRWVETGWAR